MSNVIEFSVKMLDDASGPLGKFNSSLGTIVGTAAKVAAGAVAATAGLYVFVNEMTEGTDRAAKFARTIGVSTQELMAFEHAAALSDVSAQEFERSLKILTKNAAEAAEGTGEAVSAFAALNISAGEFAGMSLDQKMGVLADSLKGVSSQAEKVQISMQLFGREGASMLNVMEGGSAGMRQLTEDAKFLGLVMSDQAAANAEAFGDSLTRVGGAAKGVGMGIANDLAPLLTGLANRMADALAGARGAIVEFVHDAVRNLFAVGIVVADVVKTIKDGFDKFFTAAGFDNFVAAAKSAFMWLLDFALGLFPFLGKALVSSFQMAFQAVIELGKWAWENVKAIFNGESGPTLGQLLMESIPEATKGIREEMQQNLGALLDYTVVKASEAGEAIGDAFGVNWDSAKQRAEEMIVSLEQYGEVATEVNNQVSDQTRGFMDYLREANAEFMAEQTNTVQYMAEQIHEIMQSAIQGVSNAFAEAIVYGTDLTTSLQNLGKQVLASIVSMLIQMGIQRLALMAIGRSATASQATQEMATGMAQTYVNAFKSTAAIPIVGPALAPGVAAASVAAAAAGATAAGTAGAGLGAGLAGAAHGGMGYVPKEATYLLDRGERVLSPGQNKDLTEFMSSGSGGGPQIVVQNMTIEVMPNATNADAFMRMDRIELRERVAIPLLNAFNELARQGVKPNWVD